jgi:cell division protein FtsN
VAPPPPLAGAPAPLAGAPVALASATPPPAAAAPILAQPATPAAGYFVQVKSDQNRTAAEAELALVAEKYKDALGQIPLSTREADLKDRGIWYRVLAGPVKSHDDADSLCKRLKGAGVQACIVQKFD